MLGRLFALHGALSASTLRGWAAPADLPTAGDEMGTYRLVRELGRGAFARVFLAEQTDLDHRLVVLKVSSRPTAEPRLLARARHPHIVEVLRHATTDDGALHLVSMPFLGGATLAAALEVQRKLGRKPRSGLDLLADLDRASAPEYPASELPGPAREILAGLSYPQSLAWVVARLAEALDHAHRRGVEHGDLKPSNVLLTAEGTPMLIDFNLAFDWHETKAAGLPNDLGGTLAYMAPERLKAIAEGDHQHAPKAADLHRADLYSLGLLLLEMLTGEPPEVARHRSGDPRELAEGLVRLRRTISASLSKGRARDIPLALHAILRRCLAPDPLDRYARGDELARDLDLWRSDRPLAYAEESRRSNLMRQVRRASFPLIAGALILAVAALVAFVASLLLEGTRREQALDKYEMVVGRADSGAFGFRRFGQWRDDDRGDLVELSARQLARYDALNDPDWQDRDDVRSLPDRERGELEAWLFEQILRQAVALGERPDSPGDWSRGLALLDRTLDRSSSEPLQAERQVLLAGLKRPDPGPSPAGAVRLPRWMDDYLAGVAAEPLHAREALGYYRDALRSRPDLFWGHYRAAVVACRIDEYPEAVDHLRHCVARNPENPALHLQLASILSRVASATSQGHKDDTLSEALAECDRALVLDPDFASAYRIRAQIRKASGRAQGVEADTERYTILSRLGGFMPEMRLRLALMFHQGTNYLAPTEGGETLSRQILDSDPGDRETRTNLAAMIALDNRPAEAISEYDRVLDADPDHLRARYQRALQFHRLDPLEANREYTRLIDHPRFEELLTQQPTAFRAYHYVATDLMNRGQLDEAIQVANRSLVHVNRSRALCNEVIIARDQASNQPKFSPRGETYYLLARINAAAARTDRSRISQVIENLGLAFAKNARFEEGWFANDRHFDGLRDEIQLRMKPRLAAR